MMMVLELAIWNYCLRGGPQCLQLHKCIVAWAGEGPARVCVCLLYLWYIYSMYACVSVCVCVNIALTFL